MIADIVLSIHLAVILFVLSGFIFIPLASINGWTWFAGRRTRILHTLIMSIVTVETIVGVSCPLTWIENSLREFQRSSSFIGYWIQQAVYWDLPSQVFIFIYSVCLAWTVLMWKLFPVPGKG